MSEAPVLVRASNLTKLYPLRRRLFQLGPLPARKVLHALDGVDLEIRRGEIFGLVGESGSGKTTLGRCLLRLVEPTSGEVEFAGEAVTGVRPAEMRRVRRKMQMIFQDPLSSLNPRLTVAQTLTEVLSVHRLCSRSQMPGRVTELLAMVGLPSYVRDRLPSQLSGGQLQRVGIARALAIGPDFIVADEALSAVDVSIQAQILALLLDLRGRFGLTLLFIAHDLSVVQYVSDRVAVMYLGKVVEVARRFDIYERPKHPYTLGLLRSIPQPDPRMKTSAIALQGDPPSPVDLPTGCRFRLRCPLATAVCARLEPALTAVGPDHRAACHHADRVSWESTTAGRA